MLIKQLERIDGIPLFICPPYLIPEFQLYETLEDGTRLYIINLVPWNDTQ